MKITIDDLVQRCERCIDGTVYHQGKPGASYTETSPCDCVNGTRPNESGEAILQLVRSFRP